MIIIDFLRKTTVNTIVMFACIIINDDLGTTYIAIYHTLHDIEVCFEGREFSHYLLFSELHSINVIEIKRMNRPT